MIHIKLCTGCILTDWKTYMICRYAVEFVRKWVEYLNSKLSMFGSFFLVLVSNSATGKPTTTIKFKLHNYIINTNYNCVTV